MFRDVRALKFWMAYIEWWSQMDRGVLFSFIRASTVMKAELLAIKRSQKLIKHKVNYANSPSNY